MNIDRFTKVSEIIERYPFLVNFLVNLNDHFRKLENPLLRKTLAHLATLETVARIAGVELSTLLRKIADKIASETGEVVNIEEKDSSQPVTNKERLEKLKSIIRGLHMGIPLEQAKAQFKDAFSDVTPAEIAAMEQQLVEEGLQQEEIKRLCDIHVAVFRERLNEQGSSVEIPEGHPVDVLQKENKAVLDFLDYLDHLLEEAKQTEKEALHEGILNQIVVSLKRLLEIEKHYLKKENQLFPVMESKGITAPPKVMWAIHDDIRSSLKALTSTNPDDSHDLFIEKLSTLLTAIREMVYKEEKILFPLCLEVLSESDWVRVHKGFSDLGYTFIKPETVWKPIDTTVETTEEKLVNHRIPLDTGLLSFEQVNLLFGHLPVDLSFVDENDTVQFYNECKERVFPRSPGVIGRKVQDCHPAKSVHIVNQILDAFRAGQRDLAEFWITLNGRFIHIRYFAVRDANGDYKGCLEVAQDVTHIRELSGEKRLLDWQ